VFLALGGPREVSFKILVSNSSELDTDVSGKPAACIFPTNCMSPLWLWGPLMVAQWLRYCATNRNVAGSIPDGVTGIFHCNNPSDRTMALGSTQPLTEWVPVAFPGGKGGRCVRLTTLPPSCAVVM
jgi:hypothetical protein